MRRLSTRTVVALPVALALVLGWGQVGLGPTVDAGRETEVAGARFKSPGMFDHIGRLRDGSPVLGTVDVAPAGDVEIAAPPDVFTEPPAVAAPPPAQLRRNSFADVVPSGGTWAVMVGINDYPGGGHDLRSAVNDVNDVNEALAKMGVPGDHRLVLRDGQANGASIRLAIDWLNAHAGPDAVAVFFYAGHVRKLGASTEAIVAADGGVLSDDDLAARLANLRAKRAWIILAACYSGGFTEVLGPGRILTAASSANERAYENLNFGRSYLVEYMVRRAMILEQASATVQSAFSYAKAELARDYPNRVPQQSDSNSGPLDLRPPGTRPPPAAPRPGSGPSPGSGSGGGSGSGSGAPPQNGEPPPPKKYDNCANLTGGVVRCDP